MTEPRNEGGVASAPAVRDYTEAYPGRECIVAWASADGGLPRRVQAFATWNEQDHTGAKDLYWVPELRYSMKVFATEQEAAADELRREVALVEKHQRNVDALRQVAP